MFSGDTIELLRFHLSADYSPPRVYQNISAFSHNARFFVNAKQDFFISSRRKNAEKHFFAAVSPLNGAQVRTISSAKISFVRVSSGSLTASLYALCLYLWISKPVFHSFHFIMFYENKKCFLKVLPLIIKIFIN